MHRRTVTVQAPAKLNLALSVGAADPSLGGMHPIASWMATVNLFDDLTITALEPGTLSRYAIVWHKDARRPSEIDWSITKDLAVRAHLSLERHVGRVGGLPVQMKIEKRIPVGGGLGGGSSDAAAMLRGLNSLFGLGLSNEELAGVARELGSDVPFLVHGGSAIVEGMGERVRRQEQPEAGELHAVLAFPDAMCPTRRVYSLFDELGRAAVHPRSLEGLAQRTPLHSMEHLFNDLAEPAMRAAPRLRDDLHALSALAERPAHISGSGSSMFVICDEQMHATALAEAVERRLNLPAVAVQATPGH
jgi:4-diphosphocytidyl-2-C-methyl-D-erythritol kinase